MNAMNPSAAAPQKEEPQWYLGLNGKPEGPMTVTQVREHVQEGRASNATMAWSAGMAGWEPAGKVEGLKAVFAPPSLQPPPLQPPPLSLAAAAAAVAEQPKQAAQTAAADVATAPKAAVAGDMDSFKGKVLNAGEQIKLFTQPIPGDRSPMVEGTNLRAANVERMAFFAVDLSCRVKAMLTVSPRHRIDVDMRPA